MSCTPLTTAAGPSARDVGTIKILLDATTHLSILHSMNTATLTDRVLTILSDKPMACVDVWDALGDAHVRSYDVTAELRALCDEERVVRVHDEDGIGYALAQRVAS